MQRMRFVRIIALSYFVLIAYFLTATAVSAEDFIPSKGSAVVTFNNQPLFVLHPVHNQYSAEERARIITDRIQQIADNEAVSSSLQIQISETHESSRLFLDGKLVMFIFDQEATAENMPRPALADKRAKIIERAIRQYHLDMQPQNVMYRFGLSFLASVVCFLLWRVNNWIALRMELILNQRREKAFPVLKFILLSEQVAGYFLNKISLFLLWFVRLILLYGYSFTILSIFPRTREYADLVLSYLWQPLGNVTELVIEVLPNLATIFIILVLFWYILGFIRLIAREIESGNIVLGGFHHEWASPTYALIRLLVIVLAFIAIFPYIPGSNSPVFQGMSVFLGLLFSVASSSALSNIVAGYVLIYTRAFKEGDVIKSGEYSGIVVHQALLATSVRTFKNEIVTVPNSLLLSGSIVNYSHNLAENRLTLHTTITIGYDVPWRTVHELLKEAALHTEGILVNPPPFVLQTALNDFHISYQLNAFTSSPEQMPRQYSALHQNIQDYFRDNNIEIMSPHYTAFRNGNQTTIPPN